jgi:hypothetical protein
MVMNRSLAGKLRICCLLVLLVFGTEQQARAYADPGSGALLWQMALAAIAGVAFYFRRIMSWFKDRKASKD